MPPELAAALKRWKRQCPPSKEGLVFPKADGYWAPEKRSGQNLCGSSRLSGCEEGDLNPQKAKPLKHLKPWILQMNQQLRQILRTGTVPVKNA